MRGASTAVIVSAAVAVALAAVPLIRRPRATPENRIAFRPIQQPDDGYVSSGACQSCHPLQFATWSGSFHRTMTQVATATAAMPDFNHASIALRAQTIRLSQRGSELWAQFDDPDSTGSLSSSRIERQIVLITGSHHQQAFWYRTDHSRLLGQLPAIYLTSERQWIPRNSAFLRPPTGANASETGRWNAVCINCHTTHGKSKLDAPLTAPGPRRADTTVAEFGIGCEACHGPGGGHALANSSPIRRYWLHLTGERDSTIVQPTRLDPRVSSEVCGQCHGVWDFYQPADERHANAEGFQYRPGAELRDTRFVAQPTVNLAAPPMRRLVRSYPTYVADSFWPDGMVRVSGREYNGLIESPCYRNAHETSRTLSCSSCHQMHKGSADRRSIDEWARTYQLSERADTNEACLKCHGRIGPDFAANLAAHTHHAATSAGSLCYNCHMPYTTYGLLRALRSHQISSPSVAVSLATGRPNACNGCHLDKTLAWTVDRLAAWYGAPRVPLDDDERAIAASLLWLLRGDAGQRALAAWSMGWRSAQEASGSSWEAPYLALLLNDPYDAVRLIALRSLETTPGLAQFSADASAPPAQRILDSQRAFATWERQSSGGLASRDPGALLVNPDGTLNLDAITRVMNRRDDRRVNLRE
jgi:hypothetical protein